MGNDAQSQRRLQISDFLPSRSPIGFVYAKSRSAAHMYVGLTLFIAVIFIVISLMAAVEQISFALSSRKSEAVVKQINADSRTQSYVVELPDRRRGTVVLYSGQLPEVGRTVTVFVDDSRVPAVETSRWPSPWSGLLLLVGPVVLTVGLGDMRKLRAIKKGSS